MSEGTQTCKHCGHKPLPEGITWRIKFLAAAAGRLHTEALIEDESCGFMYLLYDIADMISSAEAAKS
jgi:hypothetical protein